MIELDVENYRENAKVLLKGIWYSELPDLIDLDELLDSLDSLFDYINVGNAQHYKQESDGFITEWINIISPPYIRKPGVEAISFFDFKKNKSLREMQIPNLVHYSAFMYNTLIEFDSLFENLYINNNNLHYVKNSNSYLVFEDDFFISTYDGDVDWAISGTFSSTNNKINSSATLYENKRRILEAESDYIYSLKMDIESFFPNLYTHNFEKIAKKPPFSELEVDDRYFHFLDLFHQRINNNQTKGIPAGVFSSHIAAELCMLCVDEEIRNYIDKQNWEIGYVRYVDDLTFFGDSESELKELYNAVQSILNKYRLRINGNKTESIRSVYSIQPSYVSEIERQFPFLVVNEKANCIDLTELLELRKYIRDCLLSDRVSQVRTLLSILLRRIQLDNLNIESVSKELFNYLLKLVFEDVTLVSHVYRLLNCIIKKTNQNSDMVEALKNKCSKIDTEYPDTLLQIWHYYVLFGNSNETIKNEMIAALPSKNYGPLIISAMVVSGKGNNKELFKFIKESYIQESASNQWKSEIMFSKWWLPLFKISRYDSHDYDHFMNSNNFPQVLKCFGQHQIEDLAFDDFD